jgi:hypothetical protein
MKVTELPVVQVQYLVQHNKKLWRIQRFEKKHFVEIITKNNILDDFWQVYIYSLETATALPVEERELDCRSVYISRSIN